MKRINTCFPDGKLKALSLSYDDGTYADRRLIEIMNKNEIKGTFHLNGGLLGTGEIVSAAEAGELYKGHEIAAHSYSHPTLERCPKERQIDEIMLDRKILEQIAGYPVRGFSYPNGSWTSELVELLPSLGIAYARLANTSGNYDFPLDNHQLITSCHHNDRLLERTDNFLALNRKQYLYWFTIWGHSYEFDRDGNWELIEQFCNKIGRQEQVWYTTMIGMIDYMKATRRLRFSAACDMVENPSASAVWICVDEDVVEIPGGEITQL
jgi:peptidoglycan/xylan/chitin deacetylase (PgdA/CDA1 family)